ncbi:MAG: restriction endonuclease subunit M/S, partial [Proteobacteria bacterium]|nr:restriction endonuclease subunit M/S [Pseudomonadota bacterium]
PALFRDIFKNAYLPYRDPETLKSFLKVINEFTYDHSERLGDAFEYLLSVLGSQGDAGQFRTPRHIIDFIVEILAPRKEESLLDPACGTAGFLISAYKHILRTNTDARGNSTLTPDEKGRLAKKFNGYDISPDMVRLSLVNLYLHGFTDPHIFEYDSLTDTARWNEYADVILANPPFMSPKGGIRPHNRFSIQAKRSEVLFVDYIAEHLTPNGRAGIIVPEGIIFQSGTAYRQLRRTLLDDFLIGVISLPSGVFMPYTGVKTSILILDRKMARKTQSILFSEIKHIGFSLGVKRVPSQFNDLPSVLSDYQALYNGGDFSDCSWFASREEILANECNLSGNRYRPATANGTTRLVKIADVCKITKGTSSSTTTAPGSYPLILTAAEPKTSESFQLEGPAVCVPLISSTGHGKASLHRIHHVTGKFAVANLLVALQPKDDTELDSEFLYHALNIKRTDIAGLMKGAANVSMKPDDLAQFEIPLPPLEIQKEIVAEIEGYQKVINGARAVLDNYRPQIPINPDWPMVELGDVCSFKNGLNFDKTSSGHTLKIIGVSDFQNHLYAPNEDLDEVHLSKPLGDDYLLKNGDVLFVRSNGNPDLVGRSVFVRQPSEPTTFSGFTIRGRFHDDRVIPLFYAHFFKSRDFAEMIKTVGQGANIRNLSQGILTGLKVPLPPLAEQQAIVAEIESEQALVNANRELITRFEAKIQTTLSRIWGDAPQSV